MKTKSKRKKLAGANAAGVSEALTKREQLRADVAAFDAVAAARPLSPPPTRFERAPSKSAGAIALASELRNGTLRRRRAWFGPAT